MKKWRMIIDIGMTAVLLGLMAYSLIGELTHEILGTAMIVSVIASAVSGIVLSQHLYRFLNISKGASIARSIHLVCAYLNYILMSLHLGLVRLHRSLSGRVAEKTGQERKQ